MPARHTLLFLLLQTSLGQLGGVVHGGNVEHRCGWHQEGGLLSTGISDRAGCEAEHGVRDRLDASGSGSEVAAGPSATSGGAGAGERRRELRGRTPDAAWQGRGR